MGVKTRYWGRFAWRWLHDMARHLDLRHKASFQTEFFETILNCLPCPHCRRCSLKFLGNFCLPPSRIPVCNRYFVYCLHEHVNLKLFQQEIYDTVMREESLDDTFCYWHNYQPQFHKVKYYSPHSDRSTRAFIEMLYYIFMDMDDERVPYLSRLLQYAHLIYSVTIEPLPSFSTAPDLRIAFVFRLEQQMKYPIIPISHRILLCRASVVSKCT